jgi:ATP-dependent 26S proteasome regulatory subunit
MTTVLRKLHAATGGAHLTLRDFIDAHRMQHPLAMEATLDGLIMGSLRDHEVVYVDDLMIITNVMHGCGGAYPRPGLLHGPLKSAATYAIESGKKLLCAGSGSHLLEQRCYQFGIAEFKVEDYHFLARLFLGAELASRLDFDRVFRFATKLNAHQLKAACTWLKHDADLDTDRFIDYLRSQYLASNVALQEVQRATLRDLQGLDDLIERLEAQVVLPLENDVLAAKYQLRPRRGVLLAGPPGTGKTTVGRALAHRLKSKFFLIDGTCISGTEQFFGRIHQVFEAAKQNAPSIIFIDDSDVIFEGGEELGLYRYLLTMLDGLESESAGRVSVMLTAMNVGHLPPALIRSGRIELWLETRLPDQKARVSILRKHLTPTADVIGDLDIEELAAAIDGFTGADIKRLVEDGKTLLAYDEARQRPREAPSRYFLAAAEIVRQNKQLYAKAEARARAQRPARPAYFDVPFANERN